MISIYRGIKKHSSLQWKKTNTVFITLTLQPEKKDNLTSTTVLLSLTTGLSEDTDQEFMLSVKATLHGRFINTTRSVWSDVELFSRRPGPHVRRPQTLGISAVCK